MSYLNEKIIVKLREIVGPDNVLATDDDLQAHSHDELPGLHFNFRLPRANS